MSSLSSRVGSVAMMVFLLVHTTEPVLRGAAAVTDDWSRVQSLRAGQDVMVIADGTSAVSRVFVVADPGGLVVLNPHGDAWGGAASRLQDVAAHRPTALATLLAGSGGSLEDRDIALGPGGVFYRGRRLGAVADVLERFERDAVIEISVDGRTPRDRRGRALGYAGLAALGLGALVKDPEGGPGAGFYVGMPLVAGAIVLTRGERSREGVIYRRRGQAA